MSRRSTANEAPLAGEYRVRNSSRREIHLKPDRTKHYNGPAVKIKEHFYQDNPAAGPPDGWTTLPGVEYFFLGNGLIQAAVQVCSKPPGTAVGLLLMDPERLKPKSGALTFDPVSGLKPTVLEVNVNGVRRLPIPGRPRATWGRENHVPAVNVTWSAPPLAVRETFFCPDRSRPRLVRQIQLKNLSRRPVRAAVRTGIPGQILNRTLVLVPGAARVVHLGYRLVGRSREKKVNASWVGAPSISREAREYWRRASNVEFGHPLLDRFCAASRYQLQASLAASGKTDGSIWQYNREWARDLAFISIALTLSGQFELARTALRRLLSLFITPSGATIDSSEIRRAAESELDQNGALLYTLETYALWTNDVSLLRKFWRKISAAAEFPLRDVFRHSPSGLLRNSREFWERHAAHGIEEGMELAHQLWVSAGLASAVRMARHLGKTAEAARWEKEARRLKKAMLSDQDFGLVHHGVLIKRRKASGEIQEEVRPSPHSGLPDGVPLFSAGRHELNPDTSVVLPVSWEFIPPGSKLALRTLEEVEKLWNQGWKGGGYGRYNVSSEPDSPGPWPFPSLFVARAYLEAGKNSRVWRVLRWLGRAPGGQTGTWFEFYGPRPVPPYPQIGIVPWTWAEMLILLFRHLVGVRPEWDGVRLRPRLLPEMKGFRASVRLRNTRLDFVVARAEDHQPGFESGGRFFPYSKDGVLIPYPDSRTRVKAWIPRPGSWRT